MVLWLSKLSKYSRDKSFQITYGLLIFYYFFFQLHLVVKEIVLIL